jgi:ribosomal protein L7/L12
MFEDFSTLQIWLLIAGAAVIGFQAGRMSGSASPEARARYKHIAAEEAARDFARLPATAQAEIDRLTAAGKTVDAIKLIRAALNTGLYEAKQIVDQRKRRSG